ncbi:RnfABCDGE type electron transport complex subunit D [Planktothricoides raciborskii]|uniref:RnfABCDGE type electron transport complex subunit D n=1 Tax=Planktothricoides raciborskii FACHB-1370 TaxID=2949576 RepID=A0ABR8EEK1_9CYAN|nr:RnfABCDGE type electron transport complex subunit D [Planktothricoides raciborskii]MBD2545208.1 RnfABCDGE type electron transport complex subunit D [Planktothricoides raciborskii FACHB-1370]MBD2583263.1 RnfABCDGE type electron transport complex subunit D [Planktothricoides raciborskii FACHB-1261]
MIFKDARDYQILFLSLFLVLGIGTRDWTIRPEFILVAIATCLATQLVMGYGSFFLAQKSWIPAFAGMTGRFAGMTGLDSTNHQSGKRYNHFTDNFSVLASLKSALITGLGLSLLLRADNYTTIAIAAFLAIASKFIFQFNHKHFFNPGNFGIIGALLLTKDAWVSPGQWGEDWWYLFLFLGAGGMVLKRVGRWDTTATFLAVYALLEVGRNFWLGWTFDVLCHRLMSGSLLLFALFMITDPRSIPNARISRIIWAVSIAILTFLLRNYFFMADAVFWALFTLSPLTLVLDYLWNAPRFNWWKTGNSPMGEIYS